MPRPHTRPSNQRSNTIRQGRYQIQPQPRQGQRSPQSLPLNLHTPIFPVRTNNPNSQARPTNYPSDHFITYLLEYPHTQPLWHAYTHHPFVQQLSTGSLPLPAFRHYLIQDYLYLIQFARANALAAYKAPSMTDCATSAAIVTHIQKEMSLHISYCHDFGLSQSNLEAQKEDQACTAYTRYVLDVGMQQDWLALQVALAPCLLGYGEIAEDIMKDAGSVKGVERNPYWRWVENYCAEDYQQAVEQGRRILESHATGLSVKRVQELVEVFAHATKVRCL